MKEIVMQVDKVQFLCNTLEQRYHDNAHTTRQLASIHLRAHLDRHDILDSTHIEYA